MQFVCVNGVVGGRSVGSRRVRTIALAVAAVAIVPSLVTAQVVVQQVEAGIAAGQPAYSPVEFGGAASVGGGAAYPGINFTAQGPNTGGTLSIHAQFVGNSFFGPGTVGAANISQVFVNAAQTFGANGFSNATPFYTNTLRMAFSTTNAFGGALVTVPNMVAPVPNAIGNNIRVTNHSYLLQYAPTSSTTGTYNTAQNFLANSQAIRRADFLIDRDNVVWVGGAVTGTQFVGGDGTSTMAWQTRNGIAVRGDAGQTTFNPALGRPGRQHADVWGGNLASFTAGQVAGSAAGLIRQSQISANTAMGDARVIKSVIMTGVNKTIQPTTFNFGGPAWQPTTQNNMDGNGGTGAFDYNSSLSILNSAQRTLATSTTATTGGVVAGGTVPTNTARGWGLGTIAAGGASVVLVNFTSGVTNLSSTLNWNVTSATTNAGANLDTNDAAVIFSDLSLELRPVTWDGLNYGLGAAIANATGRDLSSDATGSTNDNVEHIFNTAGILSPGTYALVVRGDAVRATTAAISYSTVTNGVSPTWNTDANNAVFATGGNWTGAVSPNGVSATAVLGSNITAARTVIFNSAATLGALTLNSANAYNVSTTNGSVLTLANGALGAATVSVQSGSHTLDVPVATPGTTNVLFLGSGQALTVRSLANGGAMTITGGTVVVPGAVTGTGTITVGAGSTLRSSGAGNAVASVQVLNQGGLTVNGTVGSRGVYEITGTTVPVNGPRATRANVAVVGALTIANDGAALGSRQYFGFVDLQTNDLVVRNANLSAQQTTLANLRDMVRAWSTAAAGLPGNVGLGTSSAFYNVQDAFATLAVYDNTGIGGSTTFATFDGVSVGANDVLVKYTYLGDTNLDGVVNATDLARALQGLNGTGTGWNFGDVNYDGVVDFVDVGRIQAAIRGQGAALGDSTDAGGALGGGGPGAAIPEPGGLALLAIAGLPMLRRRR